jgi:dTDP-glucose pyrophosphorylase
MDYKKHCINHKCSVIEALAKLNALALDNTLFAVNDEEKLLGSLTDGDIRRGLLKGLRLEDEVIKYIQQHPKSLVKGKYTIEQVIEYRNRGYKIVPIVDQENTIVNVINFRLHRSCLPLHAIIMAGGRGERLKPLTDTTPKPLLKIGNKPIVEHTIDRLVCYGVNDISISVRYLGEQIEEYFKDGSQKGVRIGYIEEDQPLGTIGAASMAEVSANNYVLVANADILTNVDYEDWFLDFIASGAMLSVVTIPYIIDVPYAVVDTVDSKVVSFKEKPSYTYYSNGGMYLMKKECLELIPKNSPFNATDLMQLLITKGETVYSYPLTSYWLDIGKHDDYKKAQEDIKHLVL